MPYVPSHLVSSVGLTPWHRHRRLGWPQSVFQAAAAFTHIVAIHAPWKSHSGKERVSMPDLAGAKVAYLGYCGLIDAAGVTRIAATLNAAVNEQFDSVHLCFSSLGGYVGDGIFLYHHIRSLPVRVVVHNTGTVASIATTLFVAAEHRICCPHSIFMMHPIAMPTNGNLASEVLRAALDAAQRDEARTESILRERASIPDDILVARRTRDIYLTAEEALAYGLVHDIAEFTLPPGNKIIQI